METSTPVRLCLRDLYQEDIVEMIERETRRYDLVSIEHPDHPDFATAYRILWDAFGPAGEMEEEAVIRRLLLADPCEPTASGSFFRHFLIVAKDRDGRIRGVRDGTVMVNPGYSPGLCVVYLSHIFMLPEARGTVLTYWLRIAPLEIAVRMLQDLHARGRIRLPAPADPGKYFGMQIDLAAEMEFFSPEDRLSLQRILFYGRGGFDVIDPRHFPYRQPDFRDAADIAATGDSPIPFMLLLRRIGRERQARLPLEEASAVMRLLYDHFAWYCDPSILRGSLDVVLAALEQRRARGKTDVALLPLPTGAKNLQRLKKLFRYPNFARHYAGLPNTEAYMARTRQQLAENPRWLEDEIQRLGAVLAASPRRVYGSRDRRFLVDAMPALLAEVDEAVSTPDPAAIAESPPAPITVPPTHVASAPAKPTAPSSAHIPAVEPPLGIADERLPPL